MQNATWRQHRTPSPQKATYQPLPSWSYHTTNKPKQVKEVKIDEPKLVPYDWDEMCKQLGKPRLREEVSYFGSLRASLQTKRKGRFTYEY